MSDQEQPTPPDYGLDARTAKDLDLLAAVYHALHRRGVDVESAGRLAAAYLAVLARRPFDIQTSRHAP